MVYYLFTVTPVLILSLFSAKDVDLTPYITTRLVDDFASHIRLYRRSLGKVIEHRKDGKSVTALVSQFIVQILRTVSI